MATTTALYSDARGFCCRTSFVIPSIRPGPTAPERAKDKAPSIAELCAGTATAPKKSRTPQVKLLWSPVHARSCGEACRSGTRSFYERFLLRLAKWGRAFLIGGANDPAF